MHSHIVIPNKVLLADNLKCCGREMKHLEGGGPNLPVGITHFVVWVYTTRSAIGAAKFSS
jgi:hypothetical protein